MKAIERIGSPQPIQKEAVYRINTRMDRLSKSRMKYTNQMAMLQSVIRNYMFRTGASHYDKAERIINAGMSMKETVPVRTCKNGNGIEGKRFGEVRMNQDRMAIYGQVQDGVERDMMGSMFLSQQGRDGQIRLLICSICVWRN